MKNINSNIEIYDSGYCPDDSFLNKKEPYISIHTVSRWAEYSPYFYCNRHGFGYKAFLKTFDEEDNEISELIKTFKDLPQELISRFKKMGYCSFK